MAEPTNEQAEEFRNMLTAAVMAPHRQVWYRGTLDGETVIILGYDRGGGDFAPLCVMMTDPVFDRIEIDGTKVRGGKPNGADGAGRG